MTGLPALPLHHSTPTPTPTPAGIEAVTGGLILVGVSAIVAASLFFAVVLYLQTITGGRVP